MERRETDLTDQWKFWFGEEKTGPGTEVELPHDWVIGTPAVRDVRETSQGFRACRGTGWYQKELSVAREEGRRYFLDFGGVYEKSMVWVNGTFVGGHQYGYTSFRLEITDWLRDGRNLIEVRVDSDVTPTDRWYTGCLLYTSITSMVAIGIVWTTVLANYGPVNQFLMTFGMENPPQWLSSTQWALISVEIVSIWRSMGYNAVILRCV